MYQGYPVGLLLVREERGRKKGEQGWDKAGVMQDLVGLGKDLGSLHPQECSGSHCRAGGNRGMCTDSGAHRCRLAAGVGGQTVGMRAEGAVLIKAGGWPSVARNSQILDMFKDRANCVS